MGTAKTKIVTRKKAVSKKRLVNHVAIVVDKSGSMHGIWNATRVALNGTIDDIAQNSEKLGQSALVSLYEFGDNVECRYSDRPVKAVLHDENVNFVNMGMTALLDATGKAIEDLCKVGTNDGDDHAFLLIVLTDGDENKSVTYNRTTLPRLVQKVQSTDLWTVTFMVPPGSAVSVARSLGVPQGNVAEWVATEQGAKQAGAVRRMSVGSYFTARESGLRSVKNFYVTTDASAITKKDLKTMDDIATRCRVWTVDKESQIQPFVESHGIPYRKGCAFYQLTKKEKIQSYKKILIMEKGKKAIYEGDDARALIGLPAGQNAIVTPGNHSNLDIFAQSTSTNRILVRGTRLIVDALA